MEAENGFREKRSTETAIHSLLKNILKKKQLKLEFFYDLTKTYDVVNHEILLAKLIMYGVRGIRNSWFESCLAH
jgi:hypothetical protein